LQHHTKLNIL
jgi:hypothetical protein